MNQLKRRIEKVEDENLEKCIQPPRLVYKQMASGVGEELESLDPELARAWENYKRQVEIFSKIYPSARGLEMVLVAMPRTFRYKVIESLRALWGEENEKQRTGE